MIRHCRSIQAIGDIKLRTNACMHLSTSVPKISGCITYRPYKKRQLFRFICSCGIGQQLFSACFMHKACQRNLLTMSTYLAQKELKIAYLSLILLTGTYLMLFMEFITFMTLPSKHIRQIFIGFYFIVLQNIIGPSALQFLYHCIFQFRCKHIHG